MIVPSAPRGVEGRVAGEGGGVYARMVMPAGVGIDGVWVYAGRRVDGFVFRGTDGNNYGFKGSGDPEPYYLDFDEGEYITAVSGIHGDQWDSVRIRTNVQEYGPFGGNGGSQPFQLLVPRGNKLIGMHGFVGKVVDRAGLVWAAE